MPSHSTASFAFGVAYCSPLWFSFLVLRMHSNKRNKQTASTSFYSLWRVSHDSLSDLRGKNTPNSLRNLFAIFLSSLRSLSMGFMRRNTLITCKLRYTVGLAYHFRPQSASPVGFSLSTRFLCVLEEKYSDRLEAGRPGSLRAALRQ